MNQWIAIASGGALGAMSRFWLSTATYGWLGRGFPWGTLTVNVIGSFAIGLLTVLMLERFNLSIEWRMGILLGFLGAFTTFSTFSFETVALLEQADYLKAFSNITISVVACVSATLAGIILARQWL